MRKLYFSAFAFFSFLTASAQIITFTDTRLKTKLVGASLTNAIAKDINGNAIVIDVNGDGEIEVSEALNVYDLNVGVTALAESIFNIVGLEYFTNMKKLDIRMVYVNTLNMTAFPQLEELNCSNSSQVQTINLTGLVNLKKFYCNSILHLNTTLDLSGLTSLQYLQCVDNDLTSLNITGLTNLIEVNASDNVFTSLNLTGMVHLKKLYLIGNGLSTLNVSGLTALEDLNCSSSNLTSINLTNTPALKNLDCSYTDLTSINVSANTNLETLKCTSVGFTSLNVSGLQHLTTLNCSASQSPTNFQPTLASINLSGCIALTQLLCHENKIASLNLTDLVSLTNLRCENNLLTALDTSTLINLQTLLCSDNLFTEIDLTHNLQLQSFGCTNSKLVFVDLSPLVNLAGFDLSNSTTLKYLLVKNGKNPINQWTSQSYLFEGCPNLTYLCADEQWFFYYNQIISHYGLVNLELNTYCSFVPGGTYYSLNGSATYDENNNGCDSSDPKVPHMRFNIGNGNLAVNILSNENGEVTIPVQAGAQTFSANVENSNYFSVSPASVNVNFPTTSSPFLQNFCLSANGNYPDLEIMMMPVGLARPGFDAQYKLICRNKGTNTQSGSVALTFDDAVLDFVSAVPTVASHSVNNVSWNFTNLRPFQTLEFLLTLNLNSPIETPALNGGDRLSYQAVITGTAEDTTVEDNTFAYNQYAVNSLDPNDKTCLEGNTITPEMVGKDVHYMIRFENTGTASAVNIVVKDMIDTTKFDINSLVPLNGSHPFVTKISSTNKVEFIFESINLPFDDANNDGYVTFKIKTNPGLVLGNSFSNTASIYFDYNFPIVTNNATTTVAVLANQGFAFENYMSLYPNPANNILNIDLKQGISISSVSVYNVLGQLMLVIPNAQQTKTIDVSSLKTGNYFLKVNSNKGSTTTKFLKQ